MYLGNKFLKGRKYIGQKAIDYTVLTLYHYNDTIQLYYYNDIVDAGGDRNVKNQIIAWL